MMYLLIAIAAVVAYVSILLAARASLRRLQDKTWDALQSDYERRHGYCPKFRRHMDRFKVENL